MAREQIPSVLSEVAKSREQLPAILDTANNVSNAVVVAAGEMEKTRPLVPQVLDQVEKTRNAMPGIMDRAEDLISQAKTAGREASKGAVTGVLTGIVTAPFDIIGNVGKKVIGAGEEEDNVLPEEDLALATKSVMSLLDSNKLNAYKEWADSKTNHRGRATLKSIDEVSDEYNGQECKDVFVQVWEGDESIFEKLVTLCRNDKNEWIRKK